MQFASLAYILLWQKFLHQTTSNEKETTQVCSFPPLYSINPQSRPFISNATYWPSHTHCHPDQYPLIWSFDRQKSVTSLFLSWMGYCHNMPCSVIYAPAMIGGLKMILLGHEQDIQQTLQLLCHLQAKSTNGKLYLLTLDSYQLHLGLQCPILEDTQILPWMPNGWIASICKFLHFMNSSIVLEQWDMPQLCHMHDWCIMDDVLKNLPPHTHQALNNVCSCLCITMLRETTESN